MARTKKKQLHKHKWETNYDDCFHCGVHTENCLQQLPSGKDCGGYREVDISGNVLMEDVSS